MKKALFQGLLVCALLTSLNLFSQNASVDQLIGVNTQAVDHVGEKLKEFSHVREYHLWAMDQGYAGDGAGDPGLVGPDGCVFNPPPAGPLQSDPCCPLLNLKWNPTKNVADFQNFDDFYSEYAGSIFPVLTGAAPSMNGYNFFPTLSLLDTKPVCVADGDPLETINANDDKLSQTFDLALSPNSNSPNTIWMEPLYANAGNQVDFVIKVKNFSDVSNFDITLGYSSGFLETNTMPTFQFHPLVSNEVVDIEDDYNTIFSGMVNGDIEDNAILCRITHTLLPATPTGPLFINLSTFTINDDAGNPAEAFWVQAKLNILEDDQVAYYSVIDDQSVTCSTNETCYNIYTANFVDVKNFDINIAWDKSQMNWNGISSSNLNTLTANVDNSAGEAIVNFDYIGTPNGLTINSGNTTEIIEVCFDYACVGNEESIPVISVSSNPAGGSPYSLVNDLEVWQEHALWLTAFALRYGNTPANTTTTDNLFHPLIDDTDLLNQENNPTAKGYIEYFENQNEPDKNWLGSNTSAGNLLSGNNPFSFSPAQYAAMSSVDYDGHNDQVTYTGPDGLEYNIGLNNVDPNAKFVMAGISGLKAWYVEQILEWCQANRASGSDQFPFDVLNFHHYSNSISISGDSNDPTQVQIDNLTGFSVSPEEDGLKEKLEALLDELTAYPELASKEYWLTEFGYDTNPGSPQAATPDISVGGNSLRPVTDFGGMSDGDQDDVSAAISKTQADWLVRYYFAIAAAEGNGTRFSRGTIFNIVDAGGSGLFSSSGLLNKDLSPKKSWYWIMTLKSVLSGYTFEKEIENIGCSDTRVYKFSGGPYPIYAVWDTGSDGVENDCSLDFSNELAANIDGANSTLITFKDSDEDGLKKLLGDTPNININGKVINNFKVTETPKFIIFDEGIEDATLPCINAFRINNSDCNIITMGWTPTPGVLFKKFNVYLKPYENEAVAPPFDLANRDISLVASDLPGDATSADIPMDWSPCNRWWVYIVGTSDEGVISEPCGTLIYAGMKCRACAMQINANWVSSSDDCDDNTSNNIDPHTLFDFTDVGNFCKLENGPVPPNAWTGESDNTITIDFNPGGNISQGAIIRYVRLFDAGGEGRIRITLFDEFGNSAEMANFISNSPNFQWLIKTNTVAPDMEVVKIVIERSSCEANIPKFIFCGDLITIPMIQEVPPVIMQTIPTMTWRDAKTVTLQWDAVDAIPNFPAFGRLKDYSITYSDQINSRGEQVSPTVIPFVADVNLTQLEYTVEDKDIVNGITSFWIRLCTACALQAPDLAFKEALNSPSPKEVILSPNPTSGDFSVTPIEFEISDLRLISSNGIELPINSRQGRDGQIFVKTSALDAGIYLCRITADSGDIIVKKVVIIK